MRHSTAVEQALDALATGLRALDREVVAVRSSKDMHQRDIDRILKVLDGDGSRQGLEAQLGELRATADSARATAEKNTNAHTELSRDLTRRFEQMAAETAAERQRNRIVAAVVVAVATAALGYMGWMVQRMSERVLSMPGSSAPATPGKATAETGPRGAK